MPPDTRAWMIRPREALDVAPTAEAHGPPQNA